jgi:hypothetical protein
MTVVTRGYGGSTAGGGSSTFVQHPISGLMVQPNILGTINQPNLKGVAAINQLSGLMNQPSLRGQASGPGLSGKIDHCEIVPSYYPPLTGATEVWHWGKASCGDYISEILGDTYKAGKIGSSNISYGQPGPPNTDMKAVYWNNTASFFSHHTAPGTDGGGNSSGPVNISMKPGTSNFQLYFGMKSVSPQLDTFYSFFDYDIRDAASPFKAGIEIFVSTVGPFAPVSIVVLIFDDALAFHETKFVLTGTTLFNDNLWHHVKLKFDRSLTLPTCFVDSVSVAGSLVFGSALSALGGINPANGIRFGMREYTEAPSGRSNLQMCGAAYAKNLTYDWPYWGL